MRKVALFAILGLILAGCGGQSGGTGLSTPIESDHTLGSFTFRSAATNPPVTTTSATVVATGLTGSISSLKLRDRVTSLDETRIYFCGRILSEDLEIYSVNADGTNLTRLTKNAAFDEAPHISPKGDKIAFHSTRDGNYELYTMNVDGTSVTRITNDVAEDSYPSWSPDGTKLVFRTMRYGGSNIAVVNLSTLAVTQLTSGGADETPVFSPDGSKVLYTSTPQGSSSIRTVPAAGGSPTTLYSQSGLFFSPKYSPDGSQIAFIANSDLLRMPALANMTPTPVITLASSNSILDWSPDGTQIIYNHTNINGFPRLYKVNPNGSGQTLLLPDGVGAHLHHPSWGPMSVDRTLVASSGGLLSTKAAGFVFAQSGHKTQSCLVFDCTTPTSAVITRQTGLGDPTPNLVFSIDADNITTISYASATDWKGVRVVGTGAAITSANGALVSFNAVDGQVDLVLPFTGTRASGSRPTVKAEAGTKVFQGTFLGAFDRNGTNLAPQGATQVRLDPTGAITPN